MFIKKDVVNFLKVPAALLLLFGFIAGQEAVAYGPGNPPSSGFKAQVGGIVSFNALPRKGNEQLYINLGQTNTNAVLYSVEYYVLPHIAQRGDVWLGGGYKYQGQGFGGYRPTQLSSPQQQIAKGKNIVSIQRLANNPRVSDQIVFWLIQDGKTLVEKVFPFNVGNYLPAPIKVPGASTVPGPLQPMRPIPR